MGKGLKGLGVGIVAVLCAGALPLAGCGGGGASTPQSAEAKKGGGLQIAIETDPETLSPPTSISAPAIDIISQIDEPLFEFSAKGKVEPLLATDFKVSPDELTYTISLRPNVSFSNGKPLTADDVVFSLNAARKSVYYESLYEPIKAVEAKSDSVVVIKTSQPMPELEADLCLWVTGIMPKKYGGLSQEQFAQHPIGTGPFMLKSWKKGASVTLRRNPRYWQRNKPLLDEVNFQITPDSNSALTQLKGGQLDAVEAPTAAVPALEETPGFGIGADPLIRADILQLNMENPLFQDPRVREAVNLAVDREAIVSAALGGHGEPGGSFLPPVLPFVDEDLKPPAQDIAKAKALLAAAVKEKGLDPGFTLTSYASEPYAVSVSQILQQNLTEAGFNVKLKPLDASALFELTETGEFDAIMGGYYSASPDPGELVSYYLGYFAEPSGAETQELSKLAAAARQEPNNGRRRNLYYKIQEIVAEEGSTIVLDYQPIIWVLADSVVDFEVNALNAFALRNTWLNR